MGIKVVASEVSVVLAGLKILILSLVWSPIPSQKQPVPLKQTLFNQFFILNGACFMWWVAACFVKEYLQS